jgi:hypothetical protein
LPASGIDEASAQNLHARHTYDHAQIRWGAPSYTAIHHILTSPVYAGAYVYGKTRHERVLDEAGKIKKRSRKLPLSQWAVLIHEHHQGYIDRATYEANQARIGTNIRPRAHQPGGAVREGAALLQGLASCGHCGRKLRTQYPGRNARPGYYCAGKDIVQPTTSANLDELPASTASTAESLS